MIGECLARGELGEREKAWNVWTGSNRWVHPERPTRRTYRSVAHKRVGSSAGRFANNRNPLAQTNEHDHEKLDCTYCMNPTTTPSHSKGKMDLSISSTVIEVHHH